MLTVPCECFDTICATSLEPLGRCRYTVVQEAVREIDVPMDQTLATSPLREGYIVDFISGLPVLATPEEVDAVQVFSRRLVEDLNYPKDQIRTRPQFRVRQSPSDSKKSYPVDIAVFQSPSQC